MPAQNITVHRIRDAIAGAYAAESCPDQLADQLAVVAAGEGLGAREILLWIRDRPPHEMSTSHFRLWCQLYGLLR